MSSGDIYEQSHFTVALAGKTGLWWIGLRAHGGTTGGVDYVWDNGSPLTFTHWDKDQPDSGDGTCVAMTAVKIGGFWDDKQCSEKYAFVCEKPRPDITPPTKAPTPPPAQGCADGWTALTRFRNCYKLFHNVDWSLKKSWGAAYEDCVARGANLVSIHNQEEEEFLSLYSKASSKWIGLKDDPTEGGYSWSDGSPLSHTNWGHGEPNNPRGPRGVCGDDFVSVTEGPGAPTWIGLSDLLVENQYAWSDGVSPVLYTNWNDKEPNNAGGAEHCVAMTHGPLVTGKWNDDACQKNHSFVCYRKKSSSIAPPPPTKSPCRADYISWYQNCYKLVEEPATWDAAQAACKQQGGNLASIDMSYDQAFVAGVVLQGKADAWIGLRRKDDGSYMWTDGWPVFFTQWGPGEPSNIKDEGCVSMHGSRFFHGTWNDTKCDQAKPYICKISSEKPPPTPAPGDGNCPLFWKPYGRYCYLVYKGKEGFSWPDSRHYCQSMRAELVSIHSRAEVEFIRNLNYTKYHNIWIGLTRDRNFGWGWTDKTSLGFLNWAPGEPNEAFHPGDVAEENCVEMYPDGRWNDNNCLQKRGFACRHRQYYTTDDSGNPIYPTDGPGGNHGGVIAGAVIAAMVIFILIVGLLYYVFTVRGYKLSSLSLPTRTTSNIDVPAFTNPNFVGESDT
ncbi:macrophage mannose receptor 1-like protein [Lates japonicus]|uniref:Macrophage mannose receptor 1-like protein n=1 Tax=Lates japonicus TaxID=270547 RepID=A0AAD3MKH4_LATJO|nr:macrophage mannose receptor 1-like protein [Lates japonicus]